MIEQVRNVQIFSSEQMSNEAYHAHEYVSGSTLVTIFNECPAQWRFGEEKESPALHFGIASHAALLEPEKFDAEFVCDINKDDESVITSDAALKAWLKVRGIPTKSTATFADMVLLAVMTGEMPVIYKLEGMILESECKFKGQTIVKYDDYQQILQMRKVIFADKRMADMLQNSRVEMSVLCEVMIDGIWYGVKIRPDIVTKNRCVPDYKTTASMNPEKFGRDAHDRGYWLKMAFQKDVLEAAFNKDFKMGLLAQGKSAPYIHQMYWLTPEQLEVGRDQYQYALSQYQKCKDADVWPAYFDGDVDLPTPEYLARRYGFDDNSVEIKFED